MSKAKAVGAGGAIPPAVGEVEAKASQPPAARQGKAKGKGCVGRILPRQGQSQVVAKQLAEGAAANRARADALRKVCNGGKPGNVNGRTSDGGIERYFAEGELTCAEGQFHVVCEEPAKAPAKAPAVAPGEAKGKQVAAETTGNTAQPKAVPPALTAAEQAVMADLDAMMDEMR